MNEHKIAALLLLTAGAAAWSAGGKAGHYAGLGPLPDRTHAVPFGAELLATAQTRERVVAMRPDGRELFYTVLAAGPQIWQSTWREGRWQPPVRAAFSDVGFNTEPSFSPDGRSLYFVSTRPPGKGTDIWKIERSGDDWSAPIHLDAAINGDGFEWHPQVAANGDLYFAAADRAGGLGDADLYVAKRAHGAWQPATNLGTTINSSAAEWDPYVSPSGKRLLFKSDRAGGFGGRDLYVSEWKHGAWTAPRNAGPAINTADDEDAGEITPDGRYLIFARSKPGAEAWKMVWIDARAIVSR